jgi:hypothetical protein
MAELKFDHEQNMEAARKCYNEYNFGMALVFLTEAEAMSNSTEA